MSIKELTESTETSFAPKSKEFKVKVGEKEMSFVANEVGFLRSQQIAVESRGGKTGLSLLVAASITDAEGAKLTYEQVENLSPDVALAFLNAAVEINGNEEKKKAKK